MPIFRIKSVKIYTGQFLFTQAPPVVPVTNMRYACLHLLLLEASGLGTLTEPPRETPKYDIFCQSPADFPAMFFLAMSWNK